MFIELLSFNGPLATKCMSVNNDPCMTRPTLIDLNHVKFNYFPFMISLDKCNGSCNNSVDELSAKVYVPSKTKGVNVNVFNMITRMNETKTLVNYLSCTCECKFDSTAFNINQNGIMKHANVNAKTIKCAKKIIES